MSQEARNNAARKHDEDLLACSSYVETDAGATGQQNADVLGRLIVDAHARLDEIEKRLDEIPEHIGKLDARLTAMLAAIQIVERVERELRDKLGRVGDSLETVVAARLLELRETNTSLEARIRKLEQGVDGLGG